MFDIHKVKPVHGWREFIGEVGIIVLGVLIALACEQIVEATHWHIKVNETMAAVSDAGAAHIFSATEQQMATPCILQQLDDLEARLLTPGPFVPVPLYTDVKTASYVVRAPTRIWSDSVWNTVVSEGVSTHYDPDERFVLDLFYSSVAQERQLGLEVADLNSRLNALSRPIAKNDAMVLHFVEIIESLKSKEQLMTVVANYINLNARYAKIMTSPHVLRNAIYMQSGTLSFCQSKHFKTRSFKSIDLSAINIPK